MSKAKLTASEWELVKDAPYWINAALAAADGRVAILTSRREAQALDKALDEYKSSNTLVQEVATNDSAPAKATKQATLSDAEKALQQIATIVENKLGEDDLDTFNEFLLHIGRAIAESAGEGVLGIGANTSKAETAALQTIAEALRATDTHQRERHLAKQRREQARQAEAKAEAEEKAAKAKAAAEARAEEEAKKAKAAEVEARMKAERVRRAAEAEEREAAMAKAKAEREAAAKAAAEAKAEREAEAKAAAEAKAEREAAAKAADEAKAAAEAEAEEAAASGAAEFITEHTVVAGDNLSMISQKYYGTQTNWRLIYEANQQVIGANPSLIRVGQVLRIPKL